jgi:phosphomannomutase
VTAEPQPAVVPAPAVEGDADFMARVMAWIADDPDPDTRTQLEELVESRDFVTLSELFAAPLAFGTAGLRAAIGPGPARMNRLVVRQATAGFAAWLIEQGRALGEGHDRGLVVVGHDARHGSRPFAEDTAAVLVAAGFRVALSQSHVPTPLVAFATLHLNAVGGIQVTASHNPPADNGYKVYLGDGAQIVSPADREIEVHIRNVSKSKIPVATYPHQDITEWGDEIAAAYLAGLRGVDPSTTTDAERSRLRIVYTAMHGVGAETLLKAFALTGFTDVHPVPEQQHPDPDFPTVAFPNPEEPGALDLAIAFASKVGAHLILANDPDADRMTAAVPDALSPSGWKALRGDEIGWLLADSLLDATAEMGAKRFVATTVVSSSLLSSMAAQHGVEYAETLTGFKYLARASMARPDLHTVLMYEEAIGFCVGPLVRDKDGISAAVAMADLAARVHADGSTMLARLAHVADRYGASQTSQLSIRFDGADAATQMAALMVRLRAAPPQELDGIAVTEWRDLALADPPADVVVIKVGERGRVVVRPSGTEPKCKVYFEVLGEDHAPSLAGLQASMEQLLAT